MRRPGLPPSVLVPPVLVPLALLGLTVAIYWPVGRFGFVDYDDPSVVSENPHVRTGLTTANARWALSGFAVGHWEPLTWLSLQADVSVWHGRPQPMHVENVLLHAAGSAVLFGLLMSATGAVGRSAVVAALFAAHPMHVESVAWVTERRDVLSTPLLFAAVWAYVRYARAASARRRRGAWYAAFLALYGLSLSAKATGMTLPAVLLLLDVWPLRRAAWGNRRAWAPLLLEKVPVGCMAVATAAAALAAQRAGGATSSLVELTVGMRLDNAIVTAVLYVVKLAVPSGLAAFYPHPGDRPAAAVVAAAALLALATAGAWRARHRRPYLLVGWGWFVITLLPTSGLAQSGPQAMADRYSYVPSVGLFVAAVWAAADLVAWGRRSGTQRSSGRASGASALVWVGGMAVAGYAVAARRQVGFWRDSQTLFTRDAAVTGPNYVSDLVLGHVAYDRHDLAGAAALYERSIAAVPSNPKAYHDLGSCLLSAGHPDLAVVPYANAVRWGPTVALYRVSYARALSQVPGHRAEAIAQCRAALRLDPADADARAGLADLLARPPEGQP